MGMRSWKHRAAGTCWGLVLSTVLLIAGSATPVRADYLEDGRTIRGTAFTSPRASLSECLRVLSEATGVTLTVSPALAPYQLTGYVPRRPLRETMHALEDLFDAVWTQQPGAQPAYRLEPDATRTRAADEKRNALLAQIRKSIDDQSAEIVSRVKAGDVPNSDAGRWHTFALLLWNHLPSEGRDKVLRGHTVTISIPVAEAQPVYELLLTMAKKEPQPLSGPLLASFDMDDRTDLGIPLIRARATAMRANSATGAISTIDFVKLPNEKATPPELPGDPKLPAGLGEDASLSGTRDGILLRFAQRTGIPFLGRHRGQGGVARLDVREGRKLSEVVTDLANLCDASLSINARGYHLLRSRTEALDPAALPPAEVLERYLKQRPETGKVVSLDTLSLLAPLSPLQLAYLQQSNVATSDAVIARDTFALLRFYQSLTPPQRQALFSQEGLDLTTITHPQMHQLLDERAKRGDFDVHDALQEIAGLRFRFNLDLQHELDHLKMHAVRGSVVVSQSTQELPRVEAQVSPSQSPPAP